MDPLNLKRGLDRRMQIAEAMNQPPVPPPGQGMPPGMQPQGAPPGMPPGAPGGAPQMTQSQFARPFSPEERIRQAMLKAEALRRFGR